jgi:hypothetical protein
MNMYFLVFTDSKESVLSGEIKNNLVIYIG